MKRKTVSISISLVFLILSLTGVLMYLKPFQKSIALIHTLMGFVFILAAMLHIVNNIKPLSKYFQATKKSSINFGRLPALIIGLLTIVSLLSWFNLPPFGQIYDIGQRLRGDSEIFYKKLQTNSAFAGKNINVEVLQGNPTWVPTVAIWVEDKQGNYLHDLYVSEKLAKESFINMEHKRRPEALPVWSHRRGVKAEDGLFVPDKDNPIVDGMTGATPKTNYILESHLANEDLDSIRVFLEVNQSFDWNEYYSEDAFPEDEVYSGPGKVGQPALIYATGLLSTEQSILAQMNLLGRAHHSGKDGEIYSDLEQVTTAKDIIDRILVEIR